MKRILLYSFVILGFSFIGISQDNIILKVTGAGINGNTILTGDNTDYSSGHSPFVFNASTSGTIDFYIDVENGTADEKSWRIGRYESSAPTDWSNSVCVGVCFNPSTTNPYCSPETPQGTLTIAAGANGEISFHVTTTSSSPGTGNYKLYLGCAPHEDSIEIQINYSLGIKDLKQSPSFSIYPNPSDENVFIQMNNTKNGTVKIIDLVGNEIYSESISSSSKINVSEFKNGIYFVMIESDGLKLSSRKLVVKH